MDQFMVRDPGDRTDQKADDIYREARRQSQQRLNHPRIIDIWSGVFQVDVENKQGDGEGDDTVAERFDSALGHDTFQTAESKVNPRPPHVIAWPEESRLRDPHRYAKRMNLAVSLTNVA